MKFYGRFLKMYFPILNLCVCRIDGDEEGGGAEAAPAQVDRFGNEASPDTGKVEQDPGDEQAASGKETGEEGKGEQAPAKAQDPAVVSDDDLMAALNPEESPEAKAKRLERDYSASSAEAKRLNGEQKAIKAALESQGLKLSIKDGRIDLVPTDKYSDKPAKLEFKVKDLSAEQVEALESGDVSEIEAKVLSKLAEKAVSTLVRPVPTREKEAPTLSEEKKAAVYEQLASIKDEFDMPKHENLTENKKHIEAFINHPARDQALRDAFAAAPEVMAALVNSHINAVKQGVLKRAAAAKEALDKKQKQAQQKADSTHQDAGNVSAKGGVDSFYSSIGGKSRFS
jgi:myosin heavy subunit